MKLMLMLFLSQLFLLVPMSYATPPTKIDLDYDRLTNNLHINAEHVSSRLERHYLRRMVVSLNGKELAPVYFPRQQKPAGFENDFKIIAKPHDVISVELSCSQGGSAIASLTVPEPTVASKP